VLAVGIEDGLTRLWDHPIDEASAAAATARGQDDMIYNVGCAWLTDGQRESHGYSAAFTYPAVCSDQAMADQRPIGDLFDALWQSRRTTAASKPGFEQAREPADFAASGRQGGNIGLLTGGRLDRAAYGGQAILCALVRFLHTDLYD
jgi:non-canonical (house-cleaning) NTP pyrophosphatase